MHLARLCCLILSQNCIQYITKKGKPGFKQVCGEMVMKQLKMLNILVEGRLLLFLEKQQLEHV